MKKITAWILALTLLLAGCALAEGEPFSIRSGLTWGMTPAEALATELFLEYERRETDWGGFSLRFEDVPVAGVTGGLSMGFRDGRLRFLGYTLSDGAIPLDRLKELLESKYGPEQEMDAPRLARLITALYPKSAATPVSEHCVIAPA